MNLDLQFWNHITQNPEELIFLSEGKLGIMAPREVKYPRNFFFKCLLAHHNGTHTCDLSYQEPDTRQSFESRSLKQVRVS